MDISYQQKIISTLAIWLREKQRGKVATARMWEAFIKEGTISNFQADFKKEISEAEEIFKVLSRGDTQMVCFWQQEYPSLLLHLNDYPKILFYRCIDKSLNFNELGQFISVVGSRDMVDYASLLIRNLVRDFSGNPICIVSGLANGVDASIHELALKNNLRCIAILPGGINQITPLNNEYLYNEILRKGGIVISENWQDEDIAKYHFPKRNRIIAGIGLGTVVVQAAEKSGALTTAKLAWGYGRLVYTFPARINEESFTGNVNLLRAEMAKAITGGYDVMRDLFPEMLKSSARIQPYIPSGLNIEQKQLWSLLKQSGGISLDSLCDKIDKSVGFVISLLTQLQIKGLISVDKKGNYLINEQVSNS